MNILHSISGMWKHTGGPAEVVPLLCRNLVSPDIPVTIATLAGNLSDAAVSASKHGVNIRTFPVPFRMRPWYSPAMKSAMPQIVHDADIVHGNGMWEYTNWCTGREAARQHKPHVISFHGSIMHSQQNWKTRHRLLWKVLDGPLVRQSACLHACTVEEVRHIREAGLRNPVAVIPNGTDTWPTFSDPKLLNLVPEFSKKKTLLYLSRIHPSKGTYDLVNAWCSLGKRLEDWQLMLVGPGSPRHVKRLKRLLKERDSPSSVVYLGPLFGERRIAAYQACDIFVLPSYTENFGVVVAEALASGKPVIATHGVPWPILRERHCGWWVPNTVDALRSAIIQAISTGDGDRKCMGKRGKEFVLQEYAWPVIAKKFIGTYEWILGGGKTPLWVDIR